jgi:hypothetical protein
MSIDYSSLYAVVLYISMDSKDWLQSVNHDVNLISDKLTSSILFYCRPGQLKFEFN